MDPARLLSLLQETGLHRDMELNRSENDYNREETWRWLLAVFIGVLMGVVAFSVDTGIEILTSFK